MIHFASISDLCPAMTGWNEYQGFERGRDAYSRISLTIASSSAQALTDPVA